MTEVDRLRRQLRELSEMARDYARLARRLRETERILGVFVWQHGSPDPEDVRRRVAYLSRRAQVEAPSVPRFSTHHRLDDTFVVVVEEGRGKPRV